MDHRRDEYSTIGLLWRAADRIAARWSRLHERQPVVRKSSQYDEFAMSQAGLKYLLAALQAGKIDDGYVVLIAWNGRKLTVVHTMTSPLCPCAVERRRFPGCKSHPATAPAGSNRSSHGGDEMAEAFG
jgi:hypothetical protein